MKIESGKPQVNNGPRYSRIVLDERRKKPGGVRVLDVDNTEAHKPQASHVDTSAHAAAVVPEPILLAFQVREDDVEQLLRQIAYRSMNFRLPGIRDKHNQVVEDGSNKM